MEGWDGSEKTARRRVRARREGVHCPLPHPHGQISRMFDSAVIHKILR
jgi:hypothetical protein